MIIYSPSCLWRVKESFIFHKIFVKLHSKPALKWKKKKQVVWTRVSVVPTLNTDLWLWPELRHCFGSSVEKFKGSPSQAFKTSPQQSLGFWLTLWKWKHTCIMKWTVAFLPLSHTQTDHRPGFPTSPQWAKHYTSFWEQRRTRQSWQ